MNELVESFPITSWGRIDWSRVQHKIRVENSVEILKLMGSRESIDTLFYIIWSYGDSPCVQAKLDRIIHCIDDVICVGRDQFLYCPERGIVIEFYHEDEITIGLM